MSGVAKRTRRVAFKSAGSPFAHQRDSRAEEATGQGPLGAAQGGVAEGVTWKPRARVRVK
jgi:hypothetical protein